MGFIHYIKNTVYDIGYKICAYKWRFIMCAVFCVAGIACGIAFFYAFQYGWWYFNRCEFANKLMAGGFSAFLLFLLSYLVLYLILILCNMLKETYWLCCVATFIACLYVGATVVALFTVSVIWGVLFVILIALEDIAVYCMSCFVCLCEKPICRKFDEAVRDFHQVGILLALGFIYKIVAFFVIMKILTAVI